MKVNVEKIVKHWIDGSKNDFEAAKVLFEKQLYPQCLFFCHLSVEKVIKALVIHNTKDIPPYIHDLRRLAQVAKLDLPESRLKILDILFSFNVAGRYPEEKVDFYKKYSKKKKDTQVYLRVSNELMLWLKENFLKK